MRTGRTTLTTILALLAALTTAVPATASIPEPSPELGSIGLDRAELLSFLYQVDNEPDVADPPCIVERHDLFGVRASALQAEGRVSLLPALDRALDVETSFAILPGTHVWALEQIELFPHQDESPLSRALHQGYADLVGENAFAQTVLSPDPLGYQDSSNLYAFCGGDPVNCSDPRGENAVTRTGIFVGTDDRGNIRKVDYGASYTGDIHSLYRKLAADEVPIHLRDLIVERISRQDRGTAVVSVLAPRVVAGVEAQLRHQGSVAVSTIPYVGDAKDIQEVLTGQDYLTGEQLSSSDRVITVVAAGIPFIGGKALRELAGDAAKEAIEEALEGVVYLRRDRSGRIMDYVGQAKSETRYLERQMEHARGHPDAEFEFFELDRGMPGAQLDMVEEGYIRAGGGPTTKRKAGGLSNKRHQMREQRYRAQGGDVER